MRPALKRTRDRLRALKRDPEVYAHGTRARYTCGCRCDDCRTANRLYARSRAERAAQAAAELEQAPPAPVVGQRTTPSGKVVAVTRKRACPGVNGEPCAFGSYLRKDSLAVCRKCTVQLAADRLVSATPARRHMRALSRRGVGRRAVQEACDVAGGVLTGILDGTKKRIRRTTLERILAVDADARLDGSLVPATKVAQLIESLKGEGFTEAEIARRMGYKEALQFRSERVTAKNQQRVERFYKSVME